MSYALSDTVITPGGNGTPLYRVSTSACEYNAYTDSTGCSCVIYTDPNNDFFTVCQTDSAQTAYFWTGRDDCLATHTEGANVKLIDQNGHVDSTTGSQFCTGVFASDPQVLQTVLSMPVGPDVNIAAIIGIIGTIYSTGIISATIHLFDQSRLHGKFTHHNRHAGADGNGKRGNHSSNDKQFWWWKIALKKGR
ncbi:hypothetical protein KCU67_g2539, partial [Aureobasidium melanogenum]